MALIMRPFPIRTIGRSALWGGTTIRDGFDLWEPDGDARQEDEQAHETTSGFQIEGLADAA